MSGGKATIRHAVSHEVLLSSGIEEGCVRGRGGLRARPLFPTQKVEPNWSNS